MYPVAMNADYQRQIDIARYFAGEDTAVYGGYILKPLAPALIFLLTPVAGGLMPAFMLIALLLYLACAVIFFLFAKLFLKDDILALLGTLLFIFSYPMLKYGLDLYVETGAWFFYILGLYLTLRFVQQPSLQVLGAHCAVVIIGFLWKEYSVVNYVIFNLILLLYPEFSIKKKIYWLTLYNIPFVIFNALWQLFAYIKFGASYFEWYFGTKTGAASGWSVFNVTKSMFALLTFSWFLVPFGLLKLGWQSLSSPMRLFLLTTLITPFMAFLWGWLSSRLFYVIAPMFILIAMLGLKYFSNNRYFQVSVAGLILSFNFIWTHFSF
jgi:hypothetical protein